MPKVDEIQKAEKISSLQGELTQLIAAVRTESDEKKKRKMIVKIGEYNRRIDKLKSGRLLSRETKRDIVAYSFIAPNFIGFCVFTLIPIVFAFGLAFLEWDGSNPIKWAGLDNFARLGNDIFFKIKHLVRSGIFLQCVGNDDFRAVDGFSANGGRCFCPGERRRVYHVYRTGKILQHRPAYPGVGYSGRGYRISGAITFIRFVAGI